MRFCVGESAVSSSRQTCLRFLNFPRQILDDVIQRGMIMKPPKINISLNSPPKKEKVDDVFRKHTANQPAGSLPRFFARQWPITSPRHFEFERLAVIAKRKVFALFCALPIKKSNQIAKHLGPPRFIFHPTLQQLSALNQSKTNLKL